MNIIRKKNIWKCGTGIIELYMELKKYKRFISPINIVYNLLLFYIPSYVIADAFLHSEDIFLDSGDNFHNDEENILNNGDIFHNHEENILNNGDNFHNHGENILNSGDIFHNHEENILNNGDNFHNYEEIEHVTLLIFSEG